MGSQEALNGSMEVGNSIVKCNEGPLQHMNIDENDTLDIVNDFDMYFDDINDRLTVARMVSVSVMKGMVSAVENDAAEEIAKKDLELARLKEIVYPRESRLNDRVGSCDSTMSEELNGESKIELPSSYPDTLADCDSLQGVVQKLTLAANDQFKKLKIAIDKVKGSSSLRRKSSVSESLGLGDILPEKAVDKWENVDESLQDLRKVMNSLCKQTEDTVHWSKSALIQWHREREFQQEIEGVIMKTCVRGLQEELKHRFCDQSAGTYNHDSANLLQGKIEELSSLRQELDAVSKMLAVPENGKLASHRSFDFEHKKFASNNIPSTHAFWQGNGKQEDPIITMLENSDNSQLRHLSWDELAKHYKSEIINMKRQHESTVQAMTEEYFKLRRDCLKEGSSSVPLKKSDKEFDELRKKISGVRLLLDTVISENEKLAPHSDVGDTLESLNQKLESLSRENRQLHDTLADKKREIKFLLSHVSDATKRNSEGSLTEANLRRVIANLKWAAEDARIEASLNDDLQKFLIKEVMDQNECTLEELALEIDITKEIHEFIFNEACENYEPISKCQAEDTDMESIIMEGLCAVIFRGALQEAEMELHKLNQKYVNESEARAVLEIKALESEELWRSNVAEKENLHKQIVTLEKKIDEKEKVVQEALNALRSEEERNLLASKEVDRLKAYTGQQQLLISQSLKDMEMHKNENCKLKQSLELLSKEFREIADEKNILKTVVEERTLALSQCEAREREWTNQTCSAIGLGNGLSKSVYDFQCRIEEIISRNRLRLENVSSQVSYLTQKAKRLKKMGFLYKEALKRKSSDLEKAESEVDLLGDEVDALLELLEKIYIALDHYSPILQHYPGIIEVLRMVRRELSGKLKITADDGSKWKNATATNLGG